MATRTLLAGVLGGIGMFVWQSAAHMSPLGMVGIRMLTQEGTVSEALKAGTMGDGLYLFPASMDAAPSVASGLLVYHSTNMMAMAPLQLGAEFAKELAMALILAFLMAYARITSFTNRVLFAAAAGFIATLNTNVSYLIWYGFPADFTLASIITDMIGFIVAGAIIAKVLPRTDMRARAVTA